MKLACISICKLQGHLHQWNWSMNTHPKCFCKSSSSQLHIRPAVMYRDLGVNHKGYYYCNKLSLNRWIRSSIGGWSIKRNNSESNFVLNTNGRKKKLKMLWQTQLQFFPRFSYEEQSKMILFSLTDFITQRRYHCSIYMSVYVEWYLCEIIKILVLKRTKLEFWHRRVKEFVTRRKNSIILW